MRERRYSIGTVCAAILQGMGALLITDLPALRLLPGVGSFWFFGLVLFLWGVIVPLPGLKAPERLRPLARGGFQLRLFAWLALGNLVLSVLCFFSSLRPWWYWVIQLVISQIALFPLLLAGMLRVVTRSVQLGIYRRVILLLFWWLPALNFGLALAAAGCVTREFTDEWEREELEHTRAESEICATRYPILMVHGVFFRDLHYFNYWGRVPAALKRNGARIYYGEQPSADTVADCAAVLKERIGEILAETGAEKVNIIAHSKGGLDARYCISVLGVGDRVASLTTVSTPHHGCGYADYLLGKAPVALRNWLANSYNGALRRVGEEADFLGAVRDLTVEHCTALNEQAPDDPRVLYRSVGSYMKNAGAAPFPVNLSFRLAKAFAGQNDGLVGVDSQRWGERFTLLEPAKRRGISHGDMIDLWRENIRGFDVREFYVKTVAELKEEGY